MADTEDQTAPGVGDGLVKSTTLFLTRLLTLVSAVLATAITGINAATESGGDAGKVSDAAQAPTWIGFSQGQTAAIVIALLGLVAIAGSTDLIARAWTTAAASDPMFLKTPWQCRLDRKPDVLGTLVALRAKDNSALFIPDGSTQAEWALLSDVKGR